VGSTVHKLAQFINGSGQTVDRSTITASNDDTANLPTNRLLNRMTGISRNSTHPKKVAQEQLKDS
jgi:hypothetical protein